jgi:hypothetical protein
MPIVSHSEANEELVGAARWYEERQPGLGDDFLDEVEHALRRIEADRNAAGLHPGHGKIVESIYS